MKCSTHSAHIPSDHLGLSWVARQFKIMVLLKMGRNMRPIFKTINNSKKPTQSPNQSHEKERHETTAPLYNQRKACQSKKGISSEEPVCKNFTDDFKGYK